MELRELSITEIRVGYHPRKVFRGKEELREQIQRHGLKDPLRVRPEKDGFVLIDGNRRHSVLKELGHETCPCIIEEIDERNAAHQSYLLNAEDCRRNLNPIEVSIHIKEMRERFGYSVQDLVNLGYATDDETIYNKLRLLTLPEQIQEKIADGSIKPTVGYRLARDLARSDDKDGLLQSFEDLCAESDLTVDKYQGWSKKRTIREKDEKKEEKVIDIPTGDIPGVFFKDSSNMSELPDESVHLIITSPPYNIGLEYEKGVGFGEHLKMLDGVLSECVRVLRPGRKICINAGDITTFGTRKDGKPEIQLIGHFYQDILRKHGVRLVDRIIWKKCHKGKRDFNWFTNPQVTYHRKVRHTTYRILNNTEYVYIFEKDGDARLPYPPQISKEEWKEWVDGVWEIPPVKGENGHPAPFPEELVRRLVKMYSFKEEIVLDCFGGTMTTLKVARELGRMGIGYEKEDKYKPVIMKKLGVKEGDFNKRDKKPTGNSTEVEKPSDLSKAMEKFLPAIVAEAKEKGERISRISFSRKPVLTKDEIIVKTVSVGAHLPPTSPNSSPQVSKTDDYEEPDHGEIRKSPLFSCLPSVKRDNSSLLNRIVHGNAFDVIKKIEDESVDLWLTSPPYADVKNYGQEVGVVTPDEYVDWILPLLREIYRTLKSTGSFILNINDCVVNKHRHPYVHELIFRSTKETHLKLYDTYFWVKKGTLPTGSEKRLNNWTEYLLHFCKDESSVKWNMDAVREPYDANTVSRCRYPVNTFNSEVDENGKPIQRERKLISLNPKGKRPSNVFNFPTAAAVRDKKHPAAFHIDLPTWFIKALTDEGNLVGDVFAGSGTTCLAAKMLSRKFIGMELNPEYQKIAEQRVEQSAFAMAA